MTEEVQAAPVIRVAQDLTAITHLAERLLTQAVHSANDRTLPGGDAMVALCHVADPGQYAANVEAAEWRHEANPLRWGEATLDMAHEDDDLAPVLQTLWFWSDAWRTERGYPLEGRRATLTTEAGFIRASLDWIWEHEPHWDDFATDVRRSRRRLEDLLSEGDREETTRVECDRADCERHPRLIKIRAATEADDFYKCPACRHHYSEGAFRDAFSRQLRQEGAEKYVPQPDAVDTLVNLGRSGRTIRKWLGSPLHHVADRCRDCGLTWSPGDYEECPREVCRGQLEPVRRGDADDVVHGYCDLDTHRVWVWWPDLWTKHLVTATRRTNAVA